MPPNFELECLTHFSPSLSSSESTDHTPKVRTSLRFVGTFVLDVVYSPGWSPIWINMTPRGERPPRFVFYLHLVVFFPRSPPCEARPLGGDLLILDHPASLEAPNLYKSINQGACSQPLTPPNIRSIPMGRAIPLGARGHPPDKCPLAPSVSPCGV